MFGFFSSVRRTRPTPYRRGLRLSLERLETRDCPTTGLLDPLALPLTGPTPEPWAMSPTVAAPTTTSLSAGANVITAGQPVGLTAMVNSASGTPTTGTVLFQ